MAAWNRSASKNDLELLGSGESLTSTSRAHFPVLFDPRLPCDAIEVIAETEPIRECLGWAPKKR